MTMKTVGRMSSIGRSVVVLEMKYDESLYIPEDLSFSRIIRSFGKVLMACNRGKKPQKLEEK